jgi:hypothetical protein
VVIGYAAMIWFAHGQRPSQEAMKSMVAGLATHLRDRLLRLGKRRPDKITLREHISEALKDLPSNLRPGSKAEWTKEGQVPAPNGILEAQ